MSSDPYTHYDAAYVLGALDEADRAAYEAHLATCPQCRAGLAEIAPIPPLLAGLDESVFTDPAAASDLSPEPVPAALLPRLLRTARKERARRRWLTAGLGAVAAACAAALIAVVLPSNNHTGPAPQAMTAVISSPVTATVALQPRQWGTQVDLTCWYQPGAAPPAGYRYTLVAHDAGNDTYELGSWRLTPGRKVTFTGGTALTPGEITSLTITEPGGTTILALAP